MPVKHKQRAVDASRFAMVPRNDVPRSAFTVQHTHKTTFNASTLVPVYIDEVLPGDSHRVKMTAFCRLATPLVPAMDNLYFETFFFFVPNRLVWEHWERFMGQQDSPSDTTEFLMPYIDIQSGEMQAAGLPHSLADWFGITLNGAVGANIRVNALPFRAYGLIWNEWFRDEDLEDPVILPTGDGPDSFSATYPVGYAFGLERAKRHDYFTTARPWPQKPINAATFTATLGPYVPGGNMAVPQSGAPVSGFGYDSAQTPTVGPFTVKQTGARSESFADAFDATGMRVKVSPSGQFPDIRVLINDIRTANQVQLLMERNARGGSRYTEIIRSHFGVVSPDARLQRPEYLGGGRSQVTINPVAQTSATQETGSVLGELAGIGTALANHGFSQSFTEHGLIIGLANVRADLTYQNGINRMWFRRTQFDFYWPGLAHLGEQAILSKEIYANGTVADDNLVFGYQERWAEYKYKPGRISGVFRSSYPTPIDYWHFAQNFTTRPALNAAFIREFPPVDRVLQVNTTESAQFLLDCFFDARLTRAMPMYSIPGMGPRL